MIRAILTDIEGTTTSISFVKDVLFPYAKAHLSEFITTRATQPNVRALLDEVARIAKTPLSDEESLAMLISWMDEDKKLAPLKALQGMVWEAGYEKRDFFGHIYPDFYTQLKAWHADGLRLYIFSSGSVAAQELLFRHTEQGDITPLFSGYFDTRTGAKQEAASYLLIAEQIGLLPPDVLFLSDSEAELDAAQQAGMATCQLLRADTKPSQRHPLSESFAGILQSPQ